MGVRYGAGQDGEPSGWSCMAGTSTSCPFIASLVAKINAKRLAGGKGTMGYMNPWLYATWANVSAALYDVTSGDNKGFYAYKGWDAVTGLGTPNYALLEKLALE